MIPENKIICGAMPEAIKVFPDGHFNCCISSPPYWALRDYGVDGQLGLEPTFEEYIDKLCTIYDEVKRVLRDDGTCWVNLGDTYYGGNKGEGGKSSKQLTNKGSWLDGKPFKTAKNLMPDKSLCLIPQRFAIEMVNRGWILRNVIIWHKPNPMPSSAKDRFTVDFEYVYFFVKSKKYWFEPQYEPYNYDGRNQTEMRAGKDNKWQGIRQQGQTPQSFHRGAVERWPCPLGRNKRTVWTIPTQPFPEAHFATFPEKLVEPMIKAGCPEFVCTKCGKAREKIYDKTKLPISFREWSKENNPRGDGMQKIGGGTMQKYYDTFSDGNPPPPIFKGYTDCGCKAEWRPGIVLDCFCRKLYDRQGRRQAA